MSTTEPPDHDQRFKTLKEARQMTLTHYERGQLAALQWLATRQLETKFGPLPAPVQERLPVLSIGQLERLLVDFVKVQSLKELGLED
jgi:hypothetical protein